jgi:hypothetical protein
VPAYVYIFLIVLAGDPEDRDGDLVESRRERRQYAG